MMMHARRLVCAACALGAVLVGAVVTSPGHAFAGYVSCQTDPTVLLSNGKTIQLWTTIGDDPSDVQSVSYTLYGPAGTSVVSVTYSGELSPDVESFTYVADGHPGQYSASTTVTTGTAGVSVTAYEYAGRGPRQHDSGSGSSGQSISTWVLAP